MGNCQSDYSRHHVRIENPGIRKLAPSLRRTRKIVIGYDDQDGIFFDEIFEQTMPLSPDATTLTTTSSFSTPLDPFESPSPLYPMRPSSDDSDATLLSPSGIRVLDVSPRQSSPKSRKGKANSSTSTWSRYEQTRANFSSALRARLERSTFKQATMTSPNSKETYQESEIPFFSWDISGTNLNSRFSEEESRAEKESNEFSEDEANIWAEIETEVNVTAVSVFCHQADHSRINLAVVFEDGSVVVHEVHADCDASQSPKLDPVFTLHHGSRIRSIDFSSDGKFCAVGGDDCRCTIYRLVYEEDALCEASVLTTVERVDRVCVVRFNPRQPLLAIGGFDGKVTIFSTESLDLGNELDAVFEYSLEGLVFALDWSPDGQYLAFAGSDKKCTILDGSDAWKVKTRIFRFAPVHSVKWSPANNGDLAIGSSDTTIYDLKSMSVRHRIALNTETISMRHLNRKCTMGWSPTGNYLVICDSLGDCTMFETKTFAKVQEIHRHGSLNAVCWSQSHSDCFSRNEFLVIGGDDKTLAVIKAGNETNTAQQHCHQSVEWIFDENAFKEVDDNEESSNTPIVKAIAGNVVAIAFSKGSTTRPSPFMAYSTDENRVTVLSTSDWSLIAEISFPQPATALAFTYGSKYLAYGCLDSRLYVSETYPNWSLVANIELPSPVHRSLIYSQNNRLLGAGLYDGTFKLFDPEHKHAICGSIDGNESPITTVDWSSKAVAIGKEDGTVKLYDPEKLQAGIIEAIATISKRTPIRNAAFGLNGRFLAIGTSDGLVGIYSEKGGWVLCHQLQAFKGGVASLSWCPTSRHLAVGDDRGSVKIMDTVFWADVEEAKQVFHTAEETIVSSSKPALTFSQNGNLMAFATSNQGIRVTNCSHWRLQLCLEHADKDASNVASAEI